MDGEKAHVKGKNMSHKVVFYGVEITATRGIRRLLGSKSSKVDAAEIARLDKDIAKTDKIMAARGLEAHPATPRQLAWLIDRSLGLCMPERVTATNRDLQEWEQEDLPEFTDGIHWDAPPYAKSVKIRRGSETTHVVVMSVGRMPNAMNIPKGTPWVQRTDGVMDSNGNGFPKEWAYDIDVIKESKTMDEFRHQYRKIGYQIAHYREHGQHQPTKLDNSGGLALESEGSMQSGMKGLETRTVGYWRIAVGGDTEDEALSRADAIIEEYGPEITIALPEDQYKIAREFIPGEPLGNTSFKRRMPVTTVAAAGPAISAMVGDDHGIYLGPTSGITEAVTTWNPFYSMEVREKGGLCSVIGEPGSGKSTGVGNILLHILMDGVPCTVFDPAGRFNALAKLPFLEGRVKLVDILESEPGSANPYSAIPDPCREHFKDGEAGEAEWEKAMEAARENRRELTTDILIGWLPAKMRDNEFTDLIMLQSVNRTTSEYTGSPVLVVDTMRALEGSQKFMEQAAVMADMICEVGATAKGRLIYDSGYKVAHEESRQRKQELPPLLTIYSLRGLTIPGERAKRTDKLDERLSISLLHMACWLTRRSMYYGDVHARKCAFIDEAWVMSVFESGKRLIEELSFDSRKHDMRFFIAAQFAHSLTAIGSHKLVSASLTGFLEDEENQQEALRFIPCVPKNAGYGPLLGTLSPQAEDGQRLDREFLLWDGVRVEKFRMDMSHHPDWLAALDTTSDQAKTQDRVAQLAREQEPDYDHVAEPGLHWTKPVAVSNGNGNGNSLGNVLTAVAVAELAEEVIDDVFGGDS
jgi:hypothetical protein